MGRGESRRRNATHHFQLEDRQTYQQLQEVPVIVVVVSIADHLYFVGGTSQSHLFISTATKSKATQHYVHIRSPDWRCDRRFPDIVRVRSQEPLVSERRDKTRPSRQLLDPEDPRDYQSRLYPQDGRVQARHQSEVIRKVLDICMSQCGKDTIYKEQIPRRL